jgi:hypothetical protein
MNDGNHEFDPKLEALFRREHMHLPAEPFSKATLRTIAAARRRAHLGKRLLQVAGLGALILLSPLLIDGSIWVSARLDGLLAAVPRGSIRRSGSLPPCCARSSLPLRRNGREFGEHAGLAASLRPRRSILAQHLHRIDTRRA